MPNIQKVKGQNTLVVQLTNPNNYGIALFKVIKDKGQPTNYRQQFHIKDIESPTPTRPIQSQPIEGCPSCGTHPRMGYVTGVACPNCDHTESFKAWLNKGV